METTVKAGEALLCEKEFHLDSVTTVREVVSLDADNYGTASVNGNLERYNCKTEMQVHSETDKMAIKLYLPGGQINQETSGALVRAMVLADKAFKMFQEARESQGSNAEFMDFRSEAFAFAYMYRREECEMSSDNPTPAEDLGQALTAGEVKVTAYTGSIENLPLHSVVNLCSSKAPTNHIGHFNGVHVGEGIVLTLPHSNNPDRILPLGFYKLASCVPIYGDRITLLAKIEKQK